MSLPEAPFSAGAAETGIDPKSGRLDNLARATLVAVIVLGVGLSVAHVDEPLSAWFLLVVLGLTSVFVGIVVADDSDQSAKPSRRRLFAFFAMLIALAGGLMAMFASVETYGMMWLVLMPIVGHAGMVLGRLGILIISTLCLSLVALHVLAVASPKALPETLLGVGAAMIFVLLFTTIARREAAARRALTKANQSLAQHAIEAEEFAVSQERNRLAREIHDSVGHTLTIVSIQLEAAQATLAEDPETAGRALATAADQTRRGLDEIRRSVSTLRSPISSQPLQEALEKLLAEHRATGLEIEWQVEGPRRPLPPETELTLYRGVQEALTNVRRHAEILEARVELDFRAPDRIRLRISDKGRGAASTEGGFGLLGLRERVRLLGGQLDTHSSPDQGLALVLELPA